MFYYLQSLEPKKTITDSSQDIYTLRLQTAAKEDDAKLNDPFRVTTKVEVSNVDIILPLQRVQKFVSDYLRFVPQYFLF